MIPPLPVTVDQQRKDDEHIKLLALFHFLIGGLTLIGIAFICFHYFILHSVFSHPEIWKTKDGSGVPPKELLDIFVWLYLFLGASMLAAFIGNMLSGIFLRQRKHRMFSLVIAGLNCLQFPFGSALGVFTIMVLIRDSVRQSYSD